MFHEMKEQGQKLGLYKSVGWMNSRQACIHLTVSKVKVKAIAFSQFHYPIDWENLLPRRVYRQQVDLDPHFLYYHSWQLGKVTYIGLVFNFFPRKFSRHKVDGFQLYTQESFQKVFRAQTGWLVGSQERRSEGLRA